MKSVLRVPTTQGVALMFNSVTTRRVFQLVGIVCVNLVYMVEDYCFIGVNHKVNRY